MAVSAGQQAEHLLADDAAEATRAPARRRFRRGWLVRRALLGADLVGITLAFLLSGLAVPRPGETVPDAWEFLLLVATLPGWVLLAKLLGLYERDGERSEHSTADDLPRVFELLTIGAWIVVVMLALAPRSLDPTVGRIATFWALGIALVMLTRAAARAACRRHPSYIQNTAIVGAGEVGQLVAHKFLTHPEYGINVVGFVDETALERRDDVAHVPVLGPPEQLPALVRALDLERVVVAFPNQDAPETVDLIRTLNSFEVQVDVVPRYSDLIWPGTDLYTVEGLPLWGLRPASLPRSSLLLKRACDIVVALLLLFLLLPVFALAALAIRLDSPGPVFFRQWRRGAGDRVFRIWKFRTMVDGAELRRDEIAHLNMHAASGDDPRLFKASDDPRVTRVGRILRRWSLDELPQLLNVLRGEMSLVGPRPLVLEEDDHVERWGRRRLELRPGMTGVWQVLGRNEIAFDEMVKLDYLYVTTWSLRKDLQILLRTIPILFRHDGV